MSTEDPLLLRVFGGPSITTSENATIKLSPKMATATGLACIAGPQGIGLYSFLSFLWPSGSDHILTKRLTQLLRSFTDRAGIPSPIRRDGVRIFFEDDWFHSDLSTWHESIAAGQFESAYSLLKLGLCPLHSTELTAEGEAFLSEKTHELFRSFEIAAVRELDRAAMNTDWARVMRLSEILTDTLPENRQYLMTLTTSLRRLGRSFEARMTQEIHGLPSSGISAGPSNNSILEHVPRDSTRDNHGTSTGSTRHIHPWPMVGRQEEFRKLVQILNDVPCTPAAICIIAGSLGFGKTRLVDETFCYAASLGFSAVSVHFAACRIQKTAPRGTGTFVGVAHRGKDVAKNTLSLLAHELSGLGTKSDSSICLAIEMIEEICSRGPLLLCLDDIDCAMIPQKQISHLLSSVSSLSNLVVIATAANPLVSALDSIPEATAYLTLTPLPLEDRYLLGERVSGNQLPEDLRKELEDPAAASPQFVISLAMQAADFLGTREHPSSLGRIMPRRFHVYLKDRMNALSVHGRALADILSCARHKVPVDDLASILGLPKTVIQLEVSALERLNLVRSSALGISIPSRRIRRSLENDIPEAKRVHLYSILASHHERRRRSTLLSGRRRTIESAEYHLLLDDILACRRAILESNDTGPGEQDLIEREIEVLSKIHKRHQFRDPQIQMRMARSFSDLSRPAIARYWFDRASMGFRLQGATRKSLACQALAIGMAKDDPEADLSGIHSTTEAIVQEAKAHGWWDIATSAIETSVRIYDHSSDVRGIRSLHERILHSAWDTASQHASAEPYPPLHALSLLCQAYVDSNKAWESLQSLHDNILDSERWACDTRLSSICHAILVMLGRDQSPEGQSILRSLPRLPRRGSNARGHILGTMNAAVSLLNSWNYESAVDALDTLLEDCDFRPGGHQAGLIHVNLSIALLRTRDSDGSRKHLSSAVKLLGPRPPGAARSAVAALDGLLALEQGSLHGARQALDYLESVPGDCPYDPVLPCELAARWNWYLGRRAEAICILQSKLYNKELDPVSRISISRILSEFLRRAGREDESNNVLRHGCDIASSHSMTHMFPHIISLIR